MNTSNIIKNTMIAGLGLFATNTTSSIRQYDVLEVKYHPILTETKYPTSTRLNNPHRHSLDQLKSNKRKLRKIKNLEYGWNGYNGNEINQEIISKIENIITGLDYQPQIFPTGRGSVQIEKFLDDNNFVEIEISEEEVFAYSVKNGEELEKNINVSEINDLINELYI